MKRLVQLVAVVAVLVFVGAAVGDTAPKTKDTLKGALVSITIDPVDSTKATLVVGKEKQATITADSTTKITKDDAAAKLSDLKVGDMLVVTTASGLAKKIAAHTVSGLATGNVESGKKAEKPAANEPFKGLLVTITIDPVDSTKATLVVGKEKKEKINVDSTTKITLDGAAAKLADLKDGDFLTVTPGDKVAKLVVAKSAKTETKAPATTPKS
jgi:TusA-related sulfurtransferase